MWRLYRASACQQRDLDSSCLSVCLSVECWCCVKTPVRSANFLDHSSYLTPPPLQNAKGLPLSGAVKYTGVRKLYNFQPKSSFLSNTVGSRLITGSAVELHYGKAQCKVNGKGRILTPNDIKITEIFQIWTWRPWLRPPVLGPLTNAHAVDTQQPNFDQTVWEGNFYRVDHVAGPGQNLCYTNVDVPSLYGSKRCCLSVCLSNPGMVSKLKRAVRLRSVELFYHLVGPSFYFWAQPVLQNSKCDPLVER